MELTAADGMLQMWLTNDMLGSSALSCTMRCGVASPKDAVRSAAPSGNITAQQFATQRHVDGNSLLIAGAPERARNGSSHR